MGILARCIESARNSTYTTYIRVLPQPNRHERTSHVYADASEKAIAAVAYLRTLDKDGNPDLGFVLGKAKVAPTNDIQFRVWNCVAVLAVEIAVCFKTAGSAN